MRDCPNAEMRDLLPELLNDRLTADVRAAVQAHVDSCDDCRAELALLADVRAMARTPRVDTAKIVAALPARSATRARWSVRSPLFQVAAAVVILIGGALFLASRTTRHEPGAAQNPPQLAVTPPVVVGGTVAAAEHVTPPAELTVGESLRDLSDEDLRSLLQDLDKLDAVTSSETEVVVPAFSRGGA